MCLWLMTNMLIAIYVMSKYNKLTHSYCIIDYVKKDNSGFQVLIIKLMFNSMKGISASKIMIFMFVVD